MKDLLFLAHRIPYPPNKGDKIRSFHLVRHLARVWRIHLGAFVDDPEDWPHREALKEYCAEVFLRPLSASRARWRALKGFFTGQPLTLPYYADHAMRTWVETIIAKGGVDAVLVFSSAMAQYVENFANIRRMVDYVDVDSDKWRQYAATKAWPASWVYARESQRLLEYERAIAAKFDRGFFVSEAEASLFKSLAPASACKIETLENGVDTDYFDPALAHPDPYPKGASVIVFTGALDYWANVDAVIWFAHEIFPAIRSARADAMFAIVGARPSAAVRELGRLDGVCVIGPVEDVRPYLAGAHLAVAPLRIARGIQNKVLEAMAMAKPLVVSGAAMEGIDAREGLDVCVADSIANWVEAVGRVLQEGRRHSYVNREFVRQRYGWDRCLAPLDACLQPETHYDTHETLANPA